MIKKITKVVIPMLITASMVLSLAGCSKSEKAQASKPESKAVSSAPESKADAAKPEATAQINLAGVVQADTASTLVIRNADGKDLTFATTDAKMTLKDDIEDGDWVVVTYTGEIKGNDTTGTKVIAVEDDSPHIKKAVETVVVTPAPAPVAMFTTGPLHVRDNYSTDANIITTLPKGTQVSVTGDSPHGWKSIDYNGQTAYVFGDYLSATQPQSAPPVATGTVTPLEQTVYTTVALRLRDAPSLDGKVVGLAQAGASLHEVGTLGDWTLVLHDGATAYCDSEYLTTAAPANAVVHADNGLPAGVNESATDKTQYTTAPLHLRKICSTDSGVVSTVAQGTALHVVGVLDNGWSRVEYDAKTLFCSSEFLTDGAPAAPAVGTGITDCAPEQVFSLDQLHVRTEPSLGSTIIETVGLGREFTRTGYSDDKLWSRVDMDGTIAYCYTQYLTTNRPSTMDDNNDGGDVVTDQGEIPADATVTTTAPLRLHLTPSISGQVACVIPQGTSLHQMSVTPDGWSCVEYNGVVAFCSSEYLQ